MTNLDLVYYLNEKVKGPFDLPKESFKYFMNHIHLFSLTHEFVTYVPYYYDNNFECFKWVVLINFRK